MACNFNIKVVEQNDFTICIPLKKRTFVASTPIDEDVDILALEDLSVKIGGAVFPATRDAAGVMVDVSRDALACGTYDVVLTATYRGHAIKAAYFDSLTIVEWNYQSDAQQCVQGSPIMFEAGFVIYNLTDSELEALKAQLRLEIAAAQRAKEEADAAKEEYIAKAEALDDVAQQSTLTQGVQDIREDINHIDIDTSNLAKQGSDAGATLTDTQTAAQQAARDAADAKTAAQAIAGYALQGNDPTKTNTQLSAEIGQVALNAQTLQSMADSWAEMVTNRASLQGYTFYGGFVPNGVGDLIVNKSFLESIDDNTSTSLSTAVIYFFSNLKRARFRKIESITVGNLFDQVNALQELEFDVLTTLNSLYAFRNTGLKRLKADSLIVFNSGGAFRGCSALKNISLPNVTTITGNEVFYGCTDLKYIHLPSLTSPSGSSVFSSSPNIILIEIGAIPVSFNWLSSWNPTNALNASSQTLLTPEDIAAGFTSNLQKLLYNIREHIAANLPVANNTVTFSSAVKAAILADQATADAFTNKGWTIA